MRPSTDANFCSIAMLFADDFPALSCLTLSAAFL